MLNKVTLIGNLGSDPVVKTMNEGGKIVNLNIATTEIWKDKGGVTQKRTEWHRIVIFNDGIAGVAEKYLKKGSKIYIEGCLQTRKWTDKENREHTVTEVVVKKFQGQMIMLSGNEGGVTKPNPEDSQKSRESATTKANKDMEPDPFADDDIPLWSN